MEHKEFNDGKEPGILTFILHNRMTWFCAMHAGLLGVIYWTLGWKAILF
jgi:hypothetical protein